MHAGLLRTASKIGRADVGVGLGTRRLRRSGLASLLLGGLFVTVSLGLGTDFAPRSSHAQGRAGTETEEEALFKKAEEALQSNNYADAADYYDQVIKLNPTRVEAFVKRATLYLKDKSYDKAIELLSRAEKQSVSDLSIKTVLGLCLYESGQKERGLSYLEDVVRQRPEDHEAQFQIGKHYARTKPTRAITALEQYFRYRPDEARQRGTDASAQLYLGTAYFATDRYEEARKQLELARAARPRDNQIRQTLGSTMMALGNWKEGVEAYEPLLSEVQKRPAVAFNLATCYLNLNRRDEARKLAAQYRSLKPEDPRGLILLGHIERVSGQESDARQALLRYQEAQSAIAGKPVDWPTRLSLASGIARSHLILREPLKAIVVIEPLLSELRDKTRERTSEPPARAEAELVALLVEARLMAMTLSRTPPSATAAPVDLDDLGERLENLAPSDAPALALAGSAAYARTKFERARTLYDRSLSFESRLPRARTGLARTKEQLALQALGRLDEAPREAKKGRDQDKQDAQNPGLTTAATLLREAQQLDDSPSVARNLAAVYLLQGNASEAERALAGVLAGPGKSDPSLWRLQSRAAQLQGRTAAAQEAAERAVAEARKQLETTPTADAARRSAAAQRLLEARVELGARYLLTDGKGKDSRERLDKAVDTLDAAAKELATLGVEGKELLRTAQRNLALAQLRRGRLRLAEAEAGINKNGSSSTTTKQAEEALSDLAKAVESAALESGSGAKESGQAECLGALAAVQSGQYKQARELISKAREHGCELVSPYSRLGTELISVFIAYRSSVAPQQREQVLRTLPRLQGRAGSGAESATLGRLLRSLLFSTNMALAYDYHQAGRSKLAVQTLNNAKKYQVRTDSGEDDPVLQHNLAVSELNEGHGNGEKILERISPHPPESLVNLGILHDRRGEPRKALDYYRRAQSSGARTPKLREWIDTKDRLLGGQSQ